MVLKRGPKGLPRNADLKEKFPRTVVDVERNWSKTTFTGVKRVYEKGRPRGFVNRVETPGETGHAAKIAEIILFLQKNGVWVPRIKEMDAAHEVLHFENGGRTLSHELWAPHKAWSRAREQRVLELFSRMARMVGRVQSLGVCHRHPVPQNIVIRGNRLGLTDFKFADRIPKTAWVSAESIFVAFSMDYKLLNSPLGPFGYLPRTLPASRQNAIRKIFFQKLVRSYPCSAAIKRELAERLAAMRLLQIHKAMD